MYPPPLLMVAAEQWHQAVRSFCELGKQEKSGRQLTRLHVYVLRLVAHYVHRGYQGDTGIRRVR